jgi:hypothetical protein
MRIALVSFILCTVMLAARQEASWQSLNQAENKEAIPEIEILQHNPQAIEYRINIQGFYLEKQFDKDRLYDRVDFQTESATSEPGLPEVPYFSQLIAIPPNAAVETEIIALGAPFIIDDVHLPPARVSWQEGDKLPDYRYSKSAEKLVQAYPDYHTRVEAPVIFRDLRLARVNTFPVRYDNQRKQLIVYPNMTVRIHFTNTASANTKITPARPIAPSFIPVYRSSIANFDQYAIDHQLDLETGRDIMLCIMPDEYENSFAPYAEWKRRSGTDIIIATFSDIGATANTPEVVKNHISDVYYNSEIPPAYVLIIGDDGVFPAEYISYDYTFAYEDYFVEVEGSDYFPEMFIGRITNQNDYSLQVMLNKFRLYEEEPYVDETAWYKKGIVASNNAYQSQVVTKRFTRDRMLEDGQFTAVDDFLSDEGTPCDASLSDIVSSLEEGRSFLNYRGEGWSYGWAANCYSFISDDVSSLNNGRKLTFVTSIGCGVAMFDGGGGNSFGEEWIELGSLTYPRGAVAFVGPVSNTHTTYNNRIDKGIYVGMFREKMETPGQALMRGKLYMYNVFGDVSGSINWTEYHYRVFTVLGDPSVNIWKTVPEQVTVDMPTEISLGFDQLQFTVRRSSDLQPIADAEITISGTTVQKVAQTDEAGIAVIDLLTEAEEDLTVYIRGQGVYPVQNTISVVSQAVNLAVTDGVVFSDENGNNDGFINPGETITIATSIKNWGFSPASNVTFEVSSVSPDVTLINGGPIVMGDIAAKEVKVDEQVQISLAATAIIGEKIRLDYALSSNEDQGNFQHTIVIEGSNISTRGYIVDDDASETPNFRLDIGETANLLIPIANTGSDIAPNVTAILSTTDPYVTIVDSIGDYGTISFPDTVVNSGNTYSVAVSNDCPIEYQAKMSLRISTNNYFYTYEKIRNLNVSVGLLTEADPMGPDGYGYYAYTPQDSRFEQAPIYDWHEISDIGTNHYQSSHGTDYNYIIDLPFTFTYYGNDFDKLTISTDGWMAFGEYTSVIWYNASLPHVDEISNFIAIFWDDLVFPGDDNLEMGLYTYYDDVNNTFTIQWNEFSHYEAPSDRETFQVILAHSDQDDLPTNDDYIIMQYKELTEEGSCTIGIENANQNIALEYLYNGFHPAAASEIGNAMAILFTTATPSIVTGIDDDQRLSRYFALLQNYPNPFNPSTTITYQLPEASQVRLAIYDIRGAKVTTLDRGFKPQGTHDVVWDGTNSAGQAVSSGTYFYHLKAGNHSETKKMVLLK